jgi:hypothetical protein
MKTASRMCLYLSGEQLQNQWSITDAGQQQKVVSAQGVAFMSICSKVALSQYFVMVRDMLP